MILDWTPSLLSGLAVSLKIVGVSLGIGIPLGLCFALLVISTRRRIRIPAIVLIELVRGTPALVLLQLVYYGLPSSGITFTSMTSAWIALALTTAAYTSEILRAGIQSVHSGQSEAAQALGFTSIVGFTFIILPQALRVSIPALLGFSIQMFQITSLAFTIAAPELLSQAYSISASTFLYLKVLALAGAIYAIISIPMSALATALERRMNVHLDVPA